MAGTAGRAVWLVDGSDATLVADALHGLLDELVGDGDRSLLVEDLGGEDLDLASVADACRTPPFLGDRRIVVVRDMQFRNTEDVAPLLAYLDEPLDTSSLVLVGGPGKPSHPPRVPAKLVAAVKAHGHVQSTAVGRDSHGWVLEHLSAAPVTLDGPAVAHLEAHLGEDLSRLRGILEVLVASHGAGARLGVDDIEPYLGEAGSVVPWDLTDAIDDGRHEVALTLLHRMLGAGDRHPLAVLATLQRHYGNLLRIDSPSIRTEAAAATAMGIAKGRSTFPAKKALTSARRYGSGGIGDAVVLIADAELDLKGKRDWPGELVLEVLVARLARLARTGGGPARRPAARAR